jgi:hypothetical protein
MKTVLHRLLLTGLFAACTSLALAQTSMVPSAMSYQGLLTDDQGNPVAPTTPENRNVEFRVYNVATGGTAVWGEAQTVTVYKGNFSVILGNGTAVNGTPSGPAAFAAVFTNANSADFYFGITPQGGAEFAPRQKLLSSAFALRAKIAETVNASAQAAGVPSQFNWLSANNLTMNGHTKIVGSNQLEFGVGVADKQSDAGKIIYQGYSQGLDIIGAGTSSNNRRLTMWAEGGTDFKGPISFNARYGQHISFNDTLNGLGSQNEGIYLRAYDKIGFFRQGAHSDGALNPGAGGSLMAYLSLGGFTLNTGKFTGDGSGLTNLALPSAVNTLGVNGSNVIEFGRGLTKNGNNGTIFYANDSLNLTGGGVAADYTDRKIVLHTQGGLTIYGSANVSGSVAVSNGININGSTLNFGNRLGQHVNLWGNSFGMGIQSGSMYSRSGGSFSWYVGGTHADNENDAGGGSQLANWNNSRCDMYRRVYIGANPTDGQAPLEISGASTNQGLGTIAEFWNPGNGGAGYNGRTNFFTRFSIRTTNTILAPNFVATSDSRLKLPEGRSDAAQDLATLGKLAVTDYTMKDKTVDGGRKHKKLIAQQVEEVYPQAVAKTNGLVPDIFRMATAKDGVIVFNESGAADLKTGDTVRLVQGKHDFSTEITGITKAGFTVEESIEDGELFVYGRKVDDLRVVDYEEVSMLNVSATQEIYRRMQAQSKTIANLEADKAALEKQVSELRRTSEEQDERLAAIEAKFKTLAEKSDGSGFWKVKLGGK